MRKAIYISILLMNLFCVAQAQKKIIYEDTSLLQKDEPVFTPPEDNANVDDTTLIKAPVEDVTDEKDEKPADTTLYKNDIPFSYDSVKKWRNLKEYAYAKNLDSLLKSLKEEPKEDSPSRPRGSLFGNLLGSGFLKLLLITLAVCFVLFIMYRLFLTDGAFKRKPKSAKNTDAAVEEEEITKETDFERLIRQALENGNYRHAVRYHYLQTLHLLAGKNMLSLAPDKTNYQYVSEITNQDHRNAFAALTLNYEYVWYGEFGIDKNIYDKIDNNFSTLNKTI